MTVAEESRGPRGFPQHRVSRMLAREGPSGGLQPEVQVEGAFIQLSAEGVPKRQVYLGITAAEFVMVKQDTRRTLSPSAVSDDPELFDLVLGTLLPLPVLKFVILDDRAKRFSVGTCQGVNTFNFEMCQLDGNSENFWMKWRKALVKINSENGKNGGKTCTSTYSIGKKKSKADFENLLVKFGGASNTNLTNVHQPAPFRNISSISMQAKHQPEAAILNGHFEPPGNEVSDSDTSSSDVEIPLGERPSRRLTLFSCEHGLTALSETVDGEVTVLPRKSCSWTDVVSYETESSETRTEVLKLLKRQHRDTSLNDSDSDSDDDLDSYIQEIESRKAQGRSGSELWESAKQLALPKPQYTLTDIFHQVVFKSLAKRKSGLARTFADLDPVEVSLALTAITRRLVMSLRPADIQQYTASKGRKLSQTLGAVLDCSNNISKMVASEILKQETVLDRTMVIKRFTQICTHLLLHQHDFQSLAAILTGLTSLPVYRLDNTWVTLFVDEPLAFRQFLAVVKIISSKDKFLAYSRRIRTLKTKRRPYIPWLYHYLQHCKNNRRQPCIEVDLKQTREDEDETCEQSSMNTSVLCPCLVKRENREKTVNPKYNVKQKEKLNSQTSSAQPKSQNKGDTFEFSTQKTKIGGFVIDRDTGEVRKHDPSQVPPVKPKSILSLNKKSSLKSLFKRNRKEEHVHFDLKDDDQRGVQTSSNRARQSQAAETTKEWTKPEMDAAPSTSKTQHAQNQNRARQSQAAEPTKEWTKPEMVAAPSTSKTQRVRNHVTVSPCGSAPGSDTMVAEPGADSHSDTTDIEPELSESESDARSSAGYALHPSRLKPKKLNEATDSVQEGYSLRAAREVIKPRDLDSVTGRVIEGYSEKVVREIIKYRQLDGVIEGYSAMKGNNAKAAQEGIKPKELAGEAGRVIGGYSARLAREVIASALRVTADGYANSDVSKESTGAFGEDEWVVGVVDECWTSSDSAFSDGEDDADEEEDGEDQPRPGPSTEWNVRKLNQSTSTRIPATRNRELTVPSTDTASHNKASTVSRTKESHVKKPNQPSPSKSPVSNNRATAVSSTKESDIRKPNQVTPMRSPVSNNRPPTGPSADPTSNKSPLTMHRADPATQNMALTIPDADTSSQRRMSYVPNVIQQRRKSLFVEAAQEREEKRNDDTVFQDLKNNAMNRMKIRGSISLALLESEEMDSESLSENQNRHNVGPTSDRHCNIASSFDDQRPAITDAESHVRKLFNSCSALSEEHEEEEEREQGEDDYTRHEQATESSVRKPNQVRATKIPATNTMPLTVPNANTATHYKALKESSTKEPSVRQLDQTTTTKNPATNNMTLTGPNANTATHKKALEESRTRESNVRKLIRATPSESQVTHKRAQTVPSANADQNHVTHNRALTVPRANADQHHVKQNRAQTVPSPHAAQHHVTNKRALHISSADSATHNRAQTVPSPHAAQNHVTNKRALHISSADSATHNRALAIPSADSSQHRRMSYAPNVIRHRRNSLFIAAAQDHVEKRHSEIEFENRKSKTLNGMQERGSIALARMGNKNTDGESHIQKHFNSFLMKTLLEQNDRSNNSNTTPNMSGKKTTSITQSGRSYSRNQVTPFISTVLRSKDHANKRCHPISKSVSLENQCPTVDSCCLCAMRNCIYMCDRGHQLLQFQTNVVRIRPRSKKKVENFIQNAIKVNSFLSEYDILQISLPLD